MKPKPSLKYAAARRLVRLTDAYLPNVKAETVYKALERRGYTWSEAAREWTYNLQQQQAPPPTAG